MLIIIAVRKVNVAPKNMDQKTTAQKVTTWVTHNFFDSVVLNLFLSSRHLNSEKNMASHLGVEKDQDFVILCS